MYYHVWFVTKYRRATLNGSTEKRAKDAFLEVARNKNYNILEVETNRDHVHILLEATDKKELSEMVRTLKAVSAKKIHDTQYVSMGNARHFWAKRYGWREVSKDDVESIREYIRNQKKMPRTGKKNPTLTCGE